MNLHNKNGANLTLRYNVLQFLGSLHSTVNAIAVNILRAIKSFSRTDGYLTDKGIREVCLLSQSKEFVVTY
jgi:hypothetical protein